MLRIPRIRSVTDLARDAKRLMAEVQQTQEPIVITQRGREAAVLIPIELYRRMAAAQVKAVPGVRLVHPEDAQRFKLAMESIEGVPAAEAPSAGL